MTTTFTIDLPWQVQYLDDDNTVDIPAYSRGKELVYRSNRKSVKPKHQKLHFFANYSYRDYRDAEERRKHRSVK